MARTEWLRTFLAIYRTGSVTDGAAERGLSQPAASQQLAALERSLLTPLFVRRPTGVEATVHGRELYARVAAPLDALEAALDDLDASGSRPPDRPVRLGSSPEFLEAVVLPCLVGEDLALAATFGPDTALFDLLEHGELDVAVTSTTPPRRGVEATPIGTTPFVLVGAPGRAPSRPFASLEALGLWLTDQPWVSYSLELPRTRRLWLAALGRPFATRPRVVAPDLRAVLRAVELGLGVSLLPAFVCQDALGAGRVAEIHPLAGLVAEQPWFACSRQGGQPAGVAALLARLRVALAGPGVA